jgi:hypothetical protein
MSSMHHPARTAAGRKSFNMAQFLSGFAAWLGGVAFCIGFGVTAPTWVAAALTVPILAVSAASRVAARPVDPQPDPVAR